MYASDSPPKEIYFVKRLSLDFVELLVCFIHRIHKWPTSNFLFRYVFKRNVDNRLSSTAKGIFLRSLSVFCLMVSELWLIQI